MAGPIFAATREIATASSAQAIVDALRKHILTEEVDRVSVVQIGFGAWGEPMTEAVAVWDRGGIATNADIPEAIRQRILREPLIISNLEALDRGALEVKEYGRDVLRVASLAIFPLIGRTRTVGYLLLGSRQPYAYHDPQVQLLQSFATQAAVVLENVSLLDAVGRKTEQLDVVNELARSLSDVRDMETVGVLVAESISKVVNATHISVALHEPGQTHARTTTFKGRPLPSQVELAGTRIENALTANVMVQAAEVNRLPDATLWREVGAGSVMVAPLGTRDRRFGTLNVCAAEPNGMRPDDAALIEQIASLLGASLESLRVFERLQLSLEETTALYSTSLAMNAAQSLEEAYDTALNEIANLAGADHIVLYLAGPDPRSDARWLEAVAELKDGMLQTDIVSERYSFNEAPVLSQFPLSRANLMFNDMKSDIRLDEALRSRYTDAGVNALMMIPVSTGMIWLGALLIEARQGQVFTNDQARLCRNVADQAALIIDSQLLLKRAQDAADREHALRDMAAALSSTLNREAIFDIVLDSIERGIPHDAANILILEGGVVRAAAIRGYARQGIDETALRGLRIPVDQASNLRQMVETREPYVVKDTRTFPDWVDTPVTNWVRSYIGVPIYLEEEVIGFISLDSATPDYFDADTASYLQAFADQAAIALKNAQLYQESIRRAEAAADLAGLSERVQLAPNVEGVMETAVRTLQEILGEYDVRLRLAPQTEDTARRLLAGAAAEPEKDVEPGTD
jgi:GAF domain-containing protein